MLAKWDPSNGNMMLSQPQFHQWLLDLLLPYQESFEEDKEDQHGQQAAVYDMGCKLHTNLIINSCQNPEEEAHKKLNFLIRWPALIKKQVDSENRPEKDIETAKQLVRVLCT